MNKIIPVVKIEEKVRAIPLGKAIIEGGINCIEITFRTACAREAIEEIAKAFPEMTVGAGTVLTIEQCESAIKAGAKFIVSPGFSKEVLKICKTHNIEYIGGCITPIEIMQALDCGVNTVKFFPAESFGGAATIKSLSAPFPQIKFIPTGGINKDNISKYFEIKSVIACGCSSICPEKLINEGKFDEITKLCKEILKCV